MKRIITIALLLTSFIAFSQEDTMYNKSKNSVESLLSGNDKLMIGGYGEVHYNQPFGTDTKNNGKLDVHRMVMLFGYNFTPKIQFISEIEFEHVKEVYVEQAFLQYKLSKYITVKGGLLLIPMGIINEYHEPPSFNGVERPTTDNVIAPTTWREIGLGISGTIQQAMLTYQLYLINGFNGYDGTANLSGKNGFRKGRQKGAESYISSPNVTGKITFYGLKGLNLGVSAYFGNTQSTLYDGVDKNDAAALTVADSSVVGIAMIGADVRYTFNGLQVKGQYYYTNISNTDQYNEFTASSDGTLNDLGSSMTGLYAELAYNVFRPFKTKLKLSPFFRYEYIDTHNSVENNISKNMAFQKSIITTGLTFELSPNAVVKTDFQFTSNGANNETDKAFNAGIGIMF